MVKFATTIKQKYWDMKMEDEKEKGHFYEYKETSDHWRSREFKIVEALHNGEHVEAVFNIGKITHRRSVVSLELAGTRHIPEKYAKAIKTRWCYIFKCVPLEKPKDKKPQYDLDGKPIITGVKKDE